MDKKALLTERLPRADVEIPGVGTVTVRGISRYELQLAGKGTEDSGLIERRLLAMAIVDPELTESDIEAWQKCAPAGELKPVVDRFRELSGLNEGAQKSDVPTDGRDRPGV